MIFSPEMRSGKGENIYQPKAHMNEVVLRQNRRKRYSFQFAGQQFYCCPVEQGRAGQQYNCCLAV